MSGDVYAATHVAACVVVHTHSEELERLLEFLRCLADRPHEIVVCLNSNDDALRRRLESHAAIDRLIVEPGNPGFAGGVNACFVATDQPFVWVLNPDVLPTSDYLSTCLRAMSKNPRCGAVGGLLMRSDGDDTIIDSAGFVMQPWFRIVDRAAGARDVGQFEVSESVVGLCAASLLIRREAADAVAESGGVFNPDYWMYKEDQDFCLRLREQRYKCVFEPSARCVHTRGWKGGTRQDIPLQLRRHSLKNRYLLMARHISFSRDLWRLPAILVFELALLLRLLLSEPRTCAGYMMALRLLPRTIRKRLRQGQVRGVDDESNGTG